MKRWSAISSDCIENSAVDDFLQKIVDLSKEYGFSISHEDHQGAFVVENYHSHNIEWLMDAHVNPNGM